ncbi:hypothetical protein H9Q13_04645 [Pontibacter sp. JH31]|uniref:Uncharacterized protein n=1 Tax=Pontibacter aquaedesilientis TaxID=2766980 RepID=A0ABR7XDS2_9BACT|nr:hypothetical protein [Pontibacter aquaedesilientis]MBD1396443.1 hypothetical protein [Pontibacter aquaedesilientis]
MKRFLLLLLICLTCFNLAGGYAIAATIMSESPVSTDVLPEHSRQHILKKASFELQAFQVNKETEEEEDTVQSILFTAANKGLFYDFVPEFEIVNKHFLVHYGAAIKGRFPAIYLLKDSFLL